MTDEYRIGKDWKGSGSDTIPTFVYTHEDNHEKPQSGQLVSCPSFEPDTLECNSKALHYSSLLVIAALTQNY
jgi:hypothetical protein